MSDHDRSAIDAFLDNLVLPEQRSAIVDVGCGKGPDLIRFAARAGADCTLTGLDLKEENVASAMATAGDDPRLSFIACDLEQKLPLPDQCADLVFSREVLECIVDKPSLLREIHRILKPGGTVVCAHSDWDTHLFDGDDKALVRRVVQTFNDWQQAWMRTSDAWMGRRLWRTFQGSGLFQGSVHADVLMEARYEPGCYGYERARSFTALAHRGLIEQQDLDDFLQPLQRFADDGVYFFSITMYAYRGVKIG